MNASMFASNNSYEKRKKKGRKNIIVVISTILKTESKTKMHTNMFSHAVQSGMLKGN